MVLYMQGQLPDPYQRPINYANSPYWYRTVDSNQKVRLVCTQVTEGDCMINGELVSRVEIRVAQALGYNFIHHEIIEVWHEDNPDDTILLQNGVGIDGMDAAMKLSGNGSLFLLGDRCDGFTIEDKVYYDE